MPSAFRDARLRTSVPDLDGGYSIPSGRIYLPISESAVPDAVAAGAVVGRRGGVYVDLPPGTWSPAIEPMLPFVARRTIRPILPDLIPSSTWGSNLNNLLSKSSWDALRQRTMTARGNLCQICGERQGAIECHEIWAYSLPPFNAPDGSIGVQRLIGLAALCKACHAMFHYGLANIQGRLEPVKSRLLAVNQWTESDFWAHHEDMGTRYKKRAEVRWALDVSLIAGLTRLVIQGGKGGWAMGDQGELTSAIRQGGQLGWTVLIGSPYTLDGRDYPAMDPREAMDGLLSEEGDFAFVQQMGNGVTSMRSN